MRDHTLRAAIRGRRPRRGSVTRGLPAPRLAQDRAPPEDRRAAGRRSDKIACSTSATRWRKCAPDLVGIAELRWDDQLERDLAWHRAVCPEEVSRPANGDGALVQERGQPVDARPVVNPLDESVLDRVGRRVDKLVHDVSCVDEPDEAQRFARPEVLPATAQRVHGLRDELVQVLGELDDAPVAVEQDDVVMVGEDRRQDQVDAEALSRLGEAVQHRVVGGTVRTQEELPLRTATVEHVEAPRQDLTWDRHDDAARHRSKLPASDKSARVGGEWPVTTGCRTPAADFRPRPDTPARFCPARRR